MGLEYEDLLKEQVTNLTRSYNDLQRFFKRLLAEAPSDILNSDDPIHALVEWIVNLRVTDQTSEAEYRRLLRRSIEAEIALEAAKEACTCGGVQHEADGAIALMDRLEGTVSGTIEPAPDPIEIQNQKEMEHFKQYADHIRQEMERHYYGPYRGLNQQAAPMTATGVRMIEQRARNWGKSFEAAAIEAFRTPMFEVPAEYMDEIALGLGKAKAANGD